MFAALGTQGHRGRAARPDAGVLRRRGGRGAQVPPARPRRHVPVRRDGGRRRAHGGGAITTCRAASGSPPTPSCTPPAGRARPTRSTSTRPASRPTSAAGSRSTSTSAPQVPHIYAVGDVIGFPSLAATSMEQGRLAAAHACGEPVHAAAELQPIGIYTIPEISFVGKTEEELTDGRRALRGRHLALPRAGPRPDHRRLVRHAEAAGLAGRPAAARACTCSAPAPPSWSTSARR